MTAQLQAPAASRAQTERLPALRQDIELLPAPRERNGAPAWTIHDPVRNQFFRVGWFEFELLARWDRITAEELAARVNRETSFAAEASDVEAFVGHLAEAQLVASEPGATWRRFAGLAARRKQGPLKWTLHHYLFFRVPLLRPDRALGAIEPLLRFLFTPAFVGALAAALAVGLYLIGRQWDVFVARLHALTSFETLSWFFVALFFAKIVHEFGHGLVAKRHGVRVRAAGVAFMLFWPMLYTDTTDAWRLTSRRARLAIDAAGVAAELVLAILALLLWSFMPDGPARDAALLIATVTWVTTLAVNLSPFMRFDGYYLLSDFVDMPNLQPRAFDMAKWWIRARLFGVVDEPPEAASLRRRRWMIAYAVGTWIYRLILFTTIALIVYHFFIKLVGILLFLVEIVWFVAAPVAREVAVWWKRRADMRRTKAGVVALAIVAVALLVLFVPWRTRIEAPAIARAASFVRLYPTAAGRVESVHVRDGETVQPGDLMFTIGAPDIDSRITIGRAKIAESEREVELSSIDQEAAGRLGVLLGEIGARKREVAAQHDLKRRLTIHAPIGGEVRNLSEEIRPGRWVGDDTPLGVVADRNVWTATAYVNEGDVARLKIGAGAAFYGASPDAPRLAARVTDIELADVRTLDDKDLAAPHGGPIAVQRIAGDRLRPVRAIYRVRIALEEPPTTGLATRGTVQIAGEARSLASTAWRATASILIRESGF